jgi:hypothetical protein
MMWAMKISDLADNGRMTKGTKLAVRVPSRLQEKLGVTTTGSFMGLKPKEIGNRVQLVYVNVGGKRMVFRPQDLTLA